jgi:hypothetical protein
MDVRPHAVSLWCKPQAACRAAGCESLPCAVGRIAVHRRRASPPTDARRGDIARASAPDRTLGPSCPARFYNRVRATGTATCGASRVGRSADLGFRRTPTGVVVARRRPAGSARTLLSSMRRAWRVEGGRTMSRFARGLSVVAALALCGAAASAEDRSTGNSGLPGRSPSGPAGTSSPGATGTGAPNALGGRCGHEVTGTVRRLDPAEGTLSVDVAGSDMKLRLTPNELSGFKEGDQVIVSIGVREAREGGRTGSTH